MGLRDEWKSAPQSPRPQLALKRAYTHRPVVALVRLHANGRAFTLHEVVTIVDALEPARTDDGVDMAADLHTCTATERRQVRARALSQDAISHKTQSTG